MVDEQALIQRVARVEAVLLNIQVILVGIAALLAGAAMFALASVEGAGQELPFWAGLISFLGVGLALRPKSPSRARTPPVTAEK